MYTGDLRSKMLIYFCESFTQMAVKPRSRRLQYDVVQEILSGEHYVEASEGIVLEWLLRWLEYDLEIRQR